MNGVEKKKSALFAELRRSAAPLDNQDRLVIKGMLQNLSVRKMLGNMLQVVDEAGSVLRINFSDEAAIRKAAEQKGRCIGISVAVETFIDEAFNAKKEEPKDAA